VGLAAQAGEASIFSGQGGGSTRAMVGSMKTKKASSSAELKTAASRRAEQLRTRCNPLSDAERRELMDEGMRLFYATEVRPVPAHRH